MKVSAVEAKDCQSMIQAINLIKRLKAPSEFGVGEMVTMTDSLRWLQELAQSMAKSYADTEKAQGKDTSSEPSDGFKIKDYAPGNLAAPDNAPPLTSSKSDKRKRR